jgi:hypothetical protein
MTLPDFMTEHSRFAPHRWRAIVLATMALCGVVSGCGDGVHVPDQEELVGDAVSHMADASATPESFAALFATGAVPAEKERPRYRQYSYKAAAPKVTGETATAEVSIISPFTDQPVGSAEWTFVKQQGKWLLQSAPLPAELK